MRIADWAKHFLDHPALGDVAEFLRLNHGHAELNTCAYEARPVLLACHILNSPPARHLLSLIHI